MLAENTDCDAMVKLGLAYEHTASKSDKMEDNKEQDALRILVKEEVNRPNLEAEVTFKHRRSKQQKPVSNMCKKT